MPPYAIRDLVGVFSVEQFGHYHFLDGCATCVDVDSDNTVFIVEKLCNKVLDLSYVVCLEITNVQASAFTALFAQSTAIDPACALSPFVDNAVIWDRLVDDTKDSYSETIIHKSVFVTRMRREVLLPYAFSLGTFAAKYEYNFGVVGRLSGLLQSLLERLM